FYAQDEFRILPKLTLNFGLRYAILPKIAEKNGNSTSFLMTPAGVGTLVMAPKHDPLPEDVLYSMNVCAGAQPGWNGVGVATRQPCLHLSTSYGRSGVQTDYGNFQPRFSLAWRPFGNNKTVLRGAIGLYTVVASGQTWGFSANTASSIFYVNFGNPPLWT